MQTNNIELAKKAISAALKQNWNEAIKLNLLILDNKPTDKDAKIRLGRAYIQTKEFSLAKKLFKEVLAIDPINPIAKKNYEIAKAGKVDNKSTNINTTSLLKEPGTTTQAKLEITAKGFTSNSLTPGQELCLKIKKHDVDVYSCENDKKVILGTIKDEDIAKRLTIAKKNESNINASFIKGKDKEIIILIKSHMPVFKAEKQGIRPYVKKGTLDEPKLEMGDEINASEE